MIDIQIRISGDTLTDLERRVLTALAGAPVVGTPVTEEALVAEEAPVTEEAPVAEEQPAKRHRRTKAEMEADRAVEEAPEPEVTPEPEPEVTPEHTPAWVPVPTAVPDTGGANLDDAVKIATQLVSDGRVSDIKAFLAELGIKRVSELRGDQIAAFTAKFAA